MVFRSTFTTIIRYLCDSLEKTPYPVYKERKIRIEIQLQAVIIAGIQAMIFIGSNQNSWYFTAILLTPLFLSSFRQSYLIYDLAIASLYPLLTYLSLQNEFALLIPFNIGWLVILCGILSRSVRLVLISSIISGLSHILYFGHQIESFITTAKSEALTSFYTRSYLLSTVCAIGVLLLLMLSWTREHKMIQKISELRIKDVETNEKLIQEKGSSESKEMFIWTFSHELKNALNGLLGNLTIASEKNTDRSISDFLESSRVCGSVISNFIHNILDSGKLDNGNLEVVPEPTNFAEFLQKVWIIASEIIKNKRLSGSMRVSKNVPAFLMIDSQRLLQILLNLTSNSAKFTSKGSVNFIVSWETEQSPKINDTKQSETTKLNPQETILETEHLSVESQDDFAYMVPYESKEKRFLNQSYLWLDLEKKRWNQDDFLQITDPQVKSGYLKIQVIDTGCGISQEAQARLFRKFSQVSEYQNDRKMGTGLGLWITKELVNRLNGNINVCAKEGVGATFEVNLHLKTARPQRKTSGLHTSIAFSREMVSTQRRTRASTTIYKGLEGKMKHALIVDDDLFNQKIMINYLEKMGMPYIQAFDGEEAVEKFKAHCDEIQVVLIDHLMPKKDGLEASEEIINWMKTQKKPAVPVLLISGDIKKEVKTAAKQIGVKDVLGKPVEYEEISALFTNLMARA